MVTRIFKRNRRGGTRQGNVAPQAAPPLNAQDPGHRFDMFRPHRLQRPLSAHQRVNFNNTTRLFSTNFNLNKQGQKFRERPNHRARTNLLSPINLRIRRLRNPTSQGTMQGESPRNPHATRTSQSATYTPHPKGDRLTRPKVHRNQGRHVDATLVSDPYVAATRSMHSGLVFSGEVQRQSSQ